MTAFVTDMDFEREVLEAWRARADTTDACIVGFLCVESLPRGALVELQVASLKLQKQEDGERKPSMVSDASAGSLRRIRTKSFVRCDFEKLREPELAVKCISK